MLNKEEENVFVKLSKVECVDLYIEEDSSTARLIKARKFRI